MEVSNVNYAIDGNSILNDLNLSVERGSIHMIVGGSGSGKTTLLNLVAGFQKPLSGTIALHNSVVSSPEVCVAPSERDMAMVFQDLALWPHMSAEQHIVYMCDSSLSKNEKIERAHLLLKKVHLTGKEKRYPNELSGGEQQRLAIARALSRSPHYLLLDEPFSNLDEYLRKEFLDLIRALNQSEKCTILYVTHSLDEALYAGHTTSFIKEGRVVETVARERLGGMAKETIINTYLK